MRLKSLLLRDFRNYRSLDVDFSENVNILWGKNAQGKTNILEAIYFLATARSFRTLDRRNLIFWDKEGFLLSGTVVNETEKNVKITFFKNKKSAQINKRQLKKLSDLIGVLRVVIFTPEDIFLMKGSPLQRRRFIDIYLSQVDKNYIAALQTFKKILIRRNSEIKRRTGEKTPFLWDEQLSQHCAYIIKRRQEVIEELSKAAYSYHREITKNKERLKIEYQPSIKVNEPEKENIFKYLAERRKKDIEEGYTARGPHRDDISFIVDGRDAKLFGSEGQQRSVALSLKNAEFNLMCKATGDVPLILADDVLPVLDMERRKAFFPSIEGRTQIFVSSTDKRDVVNIKGGKKLFRVFSGNINEERL